MKPQIQALLQLLPIACEAMQHARHAAASKASCAQYLCKLCARIPAMHEQGFAQLQCQLHLRSKPQLLHIWRAEVAIEVQAAFTWWGAAHSQFRKCRQHSKQHNKKHMQDMPSGSL
jgi:hypothetical protein